VKNFEDVRKFERKVFEGIATTKSKEVLSRGYGEEETRGCLMESSAMLGRKEHYKALMINEIQCCNSKQGRTLEHKKTDASLSNGQKEGDGSHIIVIQNEHKSYLDFGGRRPTQCADKKYELRLWSRDGGHG